MPTWLFRSSRLFFRFTRWVILLLALGAGGMPPAWAQVRIMPLGASVTQGDVTYNSYRRALWQKLQAGGYSVDFVGSQSSNFNGPPPNPDFDPDHEGHWGWRVDELLANAQSWAATYHPDLVLLHAGTNDMLQEESISVTRDELGQLIERLRQGQPTVKILLAQLLPTTLSPGNEHITALNALLPELAKQKNTLASPVIIVDQNTGFDPVTETHDGIHPNAVGEEKMAARWYLAIQALLGPPAPATYTLTVAPGANGTVSKSPDQSSYSSGTSVTLTATPAPGYQFSGWSGDATGSVNPLGVTMNGNKNITATFTATPIAQQVTSFTLVNADTDLDIQPLLPGVTLDLATLPTKNLNIRANTDPAAVGSVVFTLNGALAQTQNQAPYSLFSDSEGDYNAWVPAVRDYSLTGQPYTQANGGGVAGSSLTLSFRVIDTGAGTITSFTLVNADTDLDIQTLTPDATLDLATLPTRNLNIRANTAPATVGSVVFALSGAQTELHTEGMRPYALFADADGDYKAWTPTAGAYTLTATPYAEAGGAGTVGQAATIRFQVLEPVAAAAQAKQPFSAPAAGAGPLQVYPNPTSDGRLRIQLAGTSPLQMRYTLFSALGTLVAVGHCSPGQPTALLSLDLSRHMTAPGVYYLLLESPAMQTRFKVLRD